MTTRGAFEHSVLIDSPPEQIWRFISEVEWMSRWMSSARIETTWEVGSPIVMDVQLAARRYEDRGTVLAFEPPRRLAYSHWTRISRLPDVEQNRSVIELWMEPEGGSTRLRVRHEHVVHSTTGEHVAFFWGTALEIIRLLAESDGEWRAPEVGG